MKAPAAFAMIIAAALTLSAMHSEAKSARYYRWQGADQVVCAQTSPGKGWKRLNGSFIKSDCSI